MLSERDPLEEVIAKIAGHERKQQRPFSFALVYEFVRNAAYLARGEERQTILNAITKAPREPGHSEDWNAGFDAAMKAVIRVLVERSQTH